MNELQEKIFNFYQEIIEDYSEEQIYEHFIIFIINGLKSKKEQYKNHKYSDLLDVYYKLIRLNDIESLNKQLRNKQLREYNEKTRKREQKIEQELKDIGGL